MLRILHSLPRTHKFLLLPVATMVAVLGAQQLYSTVSASDDETDNTEFTVVEMPIGNSDATQVVETASTPGQERPSQRSDNEGYIPLNTLKAQEIVDVMAKNGPLGLMMSKQAINRGLDQSRYNGFLGEGDLAHMLTLLHQQVAPHPAYRVGRLLGVRTAIEVALIY